MLKHLLTYILLIFSATGYAAVDTTRLYFDLDVDSLSTTSKQKIKVLLRNHVIDNTKSIIIIGYTDFLGAEDYNVVLSKERARNVAYYFLENDIHEDAITVCMGRGRIERKGVGAGGHAEDRRVDVVIVDRPRKAIVKDKPKPTPPGRPKDPNDMDVVMKPGQRKSPIDEDFKNIPLYRKPVDNLPKKPITSYKVNDSGNIYVVMRPGTKPNMPDHIKDALDPAQTPAKNAYKGGEIDINAVNAGETFVLKNIYFYPQSHTVKDESIPEMEKLANALKKFPKLKIQVEGHICCVMDFPDAFDVDDQNNHLSVNRARYIYEYLLSKGIARERLKYEGFGRSMPIVEIERTEQEADLNRRVEIRVLEK